MPSATQYFHGVENLKSMRRLGCILMVWATQLLSSPFAQTDIPPFGPAFEQGELATIYITMDMDNAQAMLFGDIDYASTTPFPATFQYLTSAVDTLIDTIAVRLRGNTSLFAPKKSFKIDLNAFISGQKSLRRNENARCCSTLSLHKRCSCV